VKYRNQTRAQLLAEIRRLNAQRDALADRLAAVVARLEEMAGDRDDVGAVADCAAHALRLAVRSGGP
jgi:hypothetical protein